MNKEKLLKEKEIIETQLEEFKRKEDLELLEKQLAKKYTTNQQRVILKYVEDENSIPCDPNNQEYRTLLRIRNGLNNDEALLSNPLIYPVKVSVRKR